MIRSLAAAALVLALFATPVHAAEPIKTTILLKTTTTNIGQKIVYPRRGVPEITSMIVEIPPGGSTGLHEHPVPLVGYVLQGQLEIRAAGGKVNRYHAGEALVEALNHSHQGFNVGTEPVRILVTIIGVKGVGYSAPMGK